MSDSTRVRVTALLLILAASILAWPVFAERPGIPTRASPGAASTSHAPPAPQAPARARE